MSFFDQLGAAASQLQALQGALEGGEGPKPIRAERGEPVDEESFAAQAEASIPGTIRMFSGCDDHQTSADVHDVSSFGLPDADGAGGACTNALLLTLAQNASPTWVELLSGMRSTLATKRFTQIPQLSSSRAISMADDFSILGDQNNGNTKALMVGINYVGQKGELKGCHNDVESMKGHLLENGFTDDPETMKVLCDDGVHEDPTQENILAGFRWLVEGAEPGTSLFFHYSGHGGSVKDQGTDEKDGKDETLIPVDYQKTGQVRDDAIFRELVERVPAGVTLTVLMDCCHSGSILDLPYMFKADSETMDAVEGGAPPSMQPNPGFNVMKVLKAAKELFELHKSGADAQELLGAAKGLIGGLF
ncbi:unnamed protein product [Chrysoparadoxa australica]